MCWSFMRKTSLTGDTPTTLSYNGVSSLIMSPDCLQTFLGQFLYRGLLNLPKQTRRVSKPRHRVSWQLKRSEESWGVLIGRKALALIPYSHWRSSIVEILWILWLNQWQSCLTCSFIKAFPAVFKRSFIVPIFKSGNSRELINYRPIAIQPSLGKVCEELFLGRVLPCYIPLLN